MPDRERREEREGLVIGPTSGGPDVEVTAAAGITGSTHSDEEIHAEISARLHASSLASHHLDVQVKDRIVTLSGTVSDDAAKHLAEHIGESVAGVRSVRSELSVAPGESGRSRTA
jgi:osmotically-inducible protein OsmY